MVADRLVVAPSANGCSTTFTSCASRGSYTINVKVAGVVLTDKMPPKRYAGVTPVIGAARPRFQNVVSPPPPRRGVRAATSSMLNLPSEIETLSPNFWETFRDRSVVERPGAGTPTRC